MLLPSGTSAVAVSRAVSADANRPGATDPRLLPRKDRYLGNRRNTRNTSDLEHVPRKRIRNVSDKEYIRYARYATTRTTTKRTRKGKTEKIVVFTTSKAVIAGHMERCGRVKQWMNITPRPRLCIRVSRAHKDPVSAYVIHAHTKTQSLHTRFTRTRTFSKS